MFEVIEDFKAKLIGLKNSEEVASFVTDDRCAIVMRHFEKQYVILKVFPHEDQIVHACIYIDFTTNETHVSYPASFKNLDLDNLVCIKVEKGITKVKYNTMKEEVCHRLGRVYPEGENYMMRTSTGAEGRGDSWPLEYLGL